ncbi:competence protein ComEC [Sphingomonas vulcanisoli]|uniref:Competence protein ComEC n=1 Tax=Sphingomonas vulcanisoli TaxID=1658060 RepID=A0ABX0TT23_9SPHN|nr:competence protein ComEC [Sphingomonas vulcanisoli]
MAPPSIAFRWPQTAWGRPRLPKIGIAIERWLEAERDQLPLWLPVALSAGIAAWFGLPEAGAWARFLWVSGVIGVLAFALGRRGRLGQAIGWFALAACAGCALAWARSNHVAAPILQRAQVVQVTGTILLVERLPARESIRLTLAPDPAAALPPKVRVSLDQDAEPKGLAAGAKVSLKARLVPPPTAAVPGAYDYARVAWFQGIGATGKALGPVAVTAPAAPGGGFQRWLDGKRGVLTRHIESEIPGNAGGVAAAFVTGDVGGIDLQASDDFRRSGLAHLLSISGLHVAAAIAAAMLITQRLLALSQRLALHAPLTLISAGAGALAGIAYTLLSGAEVPTVRSCVASLLVLGGIALGREAMTLRLVATGALIVLLFRPEALIGPSFQLSFAAVTAIVALYEHPGVRALVLKRDEAWPRKLVRELLSLLGTGLLVEAALAPIALYHFHREGLYGAFANIIAIPLSTFVIMPAEALALLFDVIGLGGPIWWAAGLSVRFLLWIAHVTATLPGAVRALPSMPLGAFLLMTAGGLWLALWRTRWRRLGFLPLAVGTIWALATPAPDLLVTGDGKHVAVRDGGTLYLLRPRAGDYVRDFLGWGAGVQGTALDLDALPTARCSDDSCVAALGDKHLLATRSSYRTDRDALLEACGWADVAVSDRRLPWSCKPRWLKLDTASLGQTGGMAIWLGRHRIETVNGDDRHPWVQRQAPAADRWPHRWRRRSG